MDKFVIHEISIIQSLPSRELHTGSKIKEDIEVVNSAYNRNINIQLFDVNTKNEFFNIIEKITEKVIFEKSIPILHIDAHGSSDKQGIILKNNEFISWVDCKPFLIDLNKATRLNLMVVFSLCYGAYFASNLQPSDRSPCWGLVGPTEA